MGLTLGFVVLFLFMGNVNSAIMRWLWDIDIELDYKGNVIHGLVLFIVLIIASIPSTFISLLVPSPITVPILIVTYSFIDGFVAKKVAMVWEGECQAALEEEYEEASAPADR